jgi:hypothetical protein
VIYATSLIYESTAFEKQQCRRRLNPEPCRKFQVIIDLDRFYAPASRDFG